MHRLYRYWCMLEDVLHSALVQNRLEKGHTYYSMRVQRMKQEASVQATELARRIQLMNIE